MQLIADQPQCILKTFVVIDGHVCWLIYCSKQRDAKHQHFNGKYIAVMSKIRRGRGSKQHDQELLGSIYNTRFSSGATVYVKVKLTQKINKYAVYVYLHSVTTG
jgi:hypothetical protein